MKKISVTLGIALAFLIALGVSTAFAKEPVNFEELRAVFIMTPKTGDVVTSPVKICIEALGVKVEPASAGMHPNSGHHHIIIDMPLPTIVEPKGMDFMRAIKEDHNHIHWSDGAECGRIKLKPGRHIIRSLFSKANHVPNNPILADTIQITVVK